MTTTLSDLQQRFFDLAVRAPGARPANEAFTSFGALDAGARLSIYADMFLWRQVDALREDFPKLAAVTGDHAFFELASDYLHHHPSTHPSLGRLGDALPSFLAERAAARPAGAAHADFAAHADCGGHAHLAGAARSDLADLAALEWTRNQVFEEAHAPVADASLLQQHADAGALRLAFTPALRLLSLPHDVVALWTALDEGLEVPAPLPSPTHVAVWRKEFLVLHAAISETEATALRRALDGAPLAVICDVFDDVPPALAAVASWFAEQWIQGELIR